MKKYFLPFLIIIFCGYAHAQEAKNVPKLDKEFTLAYGKSVKVQDARIIVKFVAVTEDSRCPENVLCVRAGNAKISLGIRKLTRKAFTTIELNLPQASKDATFKKFTIKLISLKPFPKAGQKTDPASYIATLLITKIAATKSKSP
jgi:hypothetical protein